MTTSGPVEASASALPEPLITYVFKSGGYHRLLRYALSQGATREVADDLVQETLLKAVRHYDSLRDKSALSPWLITILRSQLIEHSRKSTSLQRAEVALVDDAWEFIVETVPGEMPAAKLAEANLFRPAFELAFERFELDHPKAAEVLRYSILEGLTLSELAGRLGKSEGATREYLSHALKKARTYFADVSPNVKAAR